MGSIPGWGTKILHAAGHGPETNKYKIKGNFLIEKKKRKRIMIGYAHALEGHLVVQPGQN